MGKVYKKYRCELKDVEIFGMRSISIHHDDTLHAPSVIINANTEKPECAMTFHFLPVPIDEWDKVKAAGDDICNIWKEYLAGTLNEESGTSQSSDTEA